MLLVNSNVQYFCPGMEWEGPPKQGLYDPQNEHEACGVGFVVAIDGKRTHKVSFLPYSFPSTTETFKMLELRNSIRKL